MFYIKGQDEDKSNESSSGRHEIRKRYWTFALPFIQEKFGKCLMFSNVSPTTSNWISEGIGIGGFTVVCIANYDCARIHFYLGKNNKEKNKEAFDYLFKHKAEIEEKLGDQIKWERADDYKASYVICELVGVSITNETNWIRMAKFHAEWSKRLCDVMLPILKELYPQISYEG